MTESQRDIKKELDESGLIVLSEYKYEKRHGRIGTGYASLDTLLGGFGETGLTVVTGRRGDGKSTWVGQLSLNFLNEGNKICFYSGELNAHMFKDWIYAQAAGRENMEQILDQFGNPIWYVDEFAESRISNWLGRNYILYDNSKVIKNERNTIIERFRRSRELFGTNIYIVDNLMTARYGLDSEKDFYRSQANFATALVEFGIETNSHVILVAHPRKMSNIKGEEDINEDVAGSGDITNLASNVIQVKKASDKDKEEMNADAYITIAKNRDFGRTGKIRLKFDEASRRLVDMDGASLQNYGWHEFC